MVKEVQLAIAFADVSQSTKLYERLGDQKARTAIAACVQVMTEATEKYGGTVIKTIGDEVMSTFPTADAAADAVAFMQEEITEGMSVDGIPLAIRAGFHFGPALLEKNDVFGDAVNTAARMAGQAKAGQIMTTGATVDVMSETWQASTRQIDRSTVKGKRDPISMHEVIWQREDVTRMVTATFGQVPDAGRLVLKVGAVEAVVDADHSAAGMGRGDQNDLIVRNSLVSRLHARVEFRRGKFVLIDQSVNGTFVRKNGGEELLVRRDELILEGAGTIGLGQALNPGEPDAISFSLEI
ncbi:MAG: adenylate/guanylate cyclase domain-containing protein [Gammaproteobacteria bacterium]